MGNCFCGNQIYEDRKPNHKVVTALIIVFIDDKRTQEFEWLFIYSRRYISEGNVFSFEAGRKCAKANTLCNMVKKNNNVDFVAHYKCDGNDKNGERKYRKLTKLVLPNHKIFNPLKEEERESYYYSLMILFVPFRYEAGLILNGATVEEAFQRHRNDNDSLNMHHNKLQNL